MGFFDRFRRKTPGSEAEAEPQAEAEPEAEPVHVVVVREGMSTPSDQDMAAALAASPELLALPRRGLAQPRWWRQDDWLASGMRGVGSALAAELGIDPDLTTWRLTKDDRGARIAIVLLYK